MKRALRNRLLFQLGGVTLISELVVGTGAQIFHVGQAQAAPIFKHVDMLAVGMD